jgi:hypothetical protein
MERTLPEWKEGSRGWEAESGAGNGRRGRELGCDGRRRRDEDRRRVGAAARGDGRRRQAEVEAEHGSSTVHGHPRVGRQPVRGRRRWSEATAARSGACVRAGWTEWGGLRCASTNSKRFVPSWAVGPSISCAKWSPPNYTTCHGQLTE